MMGKKQVQPANKVQSLSSQDLALSGDVSPDPFLLARLLIGLEALREQPRERMYPYPDTLRRAWDSLSLHRLRAGHPAPGDLTGLLALCAQPLGDWFPTTLPPFFEPNMRLLHRGGGIVLTGVASEYLNEEVIGTEPVRNLAHAARIERELENRQFVALRDTLKAAYESGNSSAQAEYVRLRRFLIDKPFTTRGAILSAWVSGICSPSDIGALYRDCSRNQEYYICPRCGPLFQERGRWRGAKPDVCSDHEGSVPPQIKPYEPGLCRVTSAVHERVCLHGKDEVRLLDALHERAAAFPDLLTSVEDWPRIDTYDVRLTFRGPEGETVWAVDMKDYRNPVALGGALLPLRGHFLETGFDRGFYVFPDRREQNAPGYRVRARESAPSLPAYYRLLTVSEFLGAVDAQISEHRPAPRRPRKKNQEAA